MGKLHSIFNFNGKVGDRVYYTLNGKPVVRKAAGKRRGPKTRGEQERARLNKEFGLASAAGKLLRQALAEELRELHDRYLYQRVNRLVMQLRNFDPLAPGERTVAGGLASEEGRSAMAGFLFPKKRINFPTLHSAKRKGSQLHIEVSEANSMPTKLLEVQICFGKGVFRKHYHPFPQGLSARTVILKRRFRSRRDYTDLMLISGDGFLQGVVIEQLLCGSSASQVHA